MDRWPDGSMVYDPTVDEQTAAERRATEQAQQLETEFPGSVVWFGWWSWEWCAIPAGAARTVYAPDPERMRAMLARYAT